MQRGGHDDHIDILMRKLIFVRFPKQAFQNKFRNRLDMQHVKAALSVTKFYYMTQDRNHETGILLLLIHLVRDHLNKLSLLRVKHDRIDYSSLYDKRIKGTAYVICNSHLISPLHIGGHTLC